MSNYIRIYGKYYGVTRIVQYGQSKQIFYIRTSDIKEVREMTDDLRSRKDIEEDEYLANKENPDYREYSGNPKEYYKYIPTSLVNLGYVESIDGTPVTVSIRADMSAEDVVKLIDMAEINIAVSKAITIDEAVNSNPDNESPIIINREVWLPGEEYMPYDMVKHPNDVSKRLLCIKANSSTSHAVLSNSNFWCDLP